MKRFAVGVLLLSANPAVAPHSHRGRPGSVDLTAKPGSTEACTEAGYLRIEAQAKALSRAVEAAMVKKKYAYSHGYHGFFAPAYSQVKTRFMHAQLCNSTRPINLACEVGFMAGHTSLLFLETLPGAKMLSFDLGDNPWTEEAAAQIREMYGADRFQLVVGSSLHTVPQYHREHPGTACDVVLIDGAKNFAQRLMDIVNVRHVSSPGAVLLFDEVCSVPCTKGTAPSCSIKQSRQAQSCYERWDGTSKAYGTASELELVNVSDCKFPPGFGPNDRRPDGVCSASFTERSRTGLGAGIISPYFFKNARRAP